MTLAEKHKIKAEEKKLEKEEARANQSDQKHKQKVWECIQ